MKETTPSARPPCKTLVALASGAALMVLAGASASAQALQNPAQLNVPYGKSYNDFNQPFNPRTRDANGNRAIINGRILTGGQSTLSSGIGGSFFAGGGSFGSFGGAAGLGGFGGGAVGNQLNVITNGNWNTVIIDSTQINNGNQTVNLNGNINNNTGNGGNGGGNNGGGGNGGNGNGGGGGNSASFGRTGTPPLAGLAADGPFRVAPRGTKPSARPDGELNGDITLK